MPEAKLNQTPSARANHGNRVTVSVVVPVLNEVRLRLAIESILSQTYEPRPELVVVDGGSTDRTLDVIAEYRDRISVLIQEPDQGIFDAINKGNRIASGDVIAFLGANDRYADPWVIKDAMKRFAEEQLDACYGDVVYVDSDNKVIRSWKAGNRSSLKLYTGWQLPHPGVFMRRQVIDQYGPYNTAYPIAADYEFFLRVMMQHHIKTTYIERTIAKVAPGGLSSSFVKGNMEVARMIWRRRLYGAFLVPLLKPARKLLQYWPGRLSVAPSTSRGPIRPREGVRESVHP